MTKDKVHIKVKIVYILKDVIDTFLYKTITNEDGTTTQEDRDIPFRLRYRLERNKAGVDKRVSEFEQLKLYYLAEYGEPTEDGKNVEIKDEGKKKQYFEEIMKLLNKETTLSIIRIDPEDIDYIKDMNMSNDMTKVLIGYMTNDQELLEDLTNNVKEVANGTT